jgi:hypothetical protein
MTCLTLVRAILSPEGSRKIMSLYFNQFSDVPICVTYVVVGCQAHINVGSNCWNSHKNEGEKVTKLCHFKKDHKIA